MKKYNLIFLGFNNEYESIDIHSLKTKYNLKHIFLPKITVSVLLRLKIIFPSAYKKILKWLFEKIISKLSGEWTLICNDNEFYSESLKIDYPSVKRKIIIIRNTFNEKSVPLGINNVEYYSFDPKDCEKYNFESYEQYCSGYDELRKVENITPEFSAYFLGLDKGRKGMVSSIVKLIHGKNKIIIVKEPLNFIEKTQKILLKSNEFNGISYIEHLQNVKNSKIIIDIIKPGQSGLTMRPLEALLNFKKVITNNKQIISEPFYHPNNVFIIDTFESLEKESIDNFLAKSFYLDSKLYENLLHRNFSSVLNKILNRVENDKA